MTQYTVLQPRQHSLLEFVRRPKMLIAGGAVVFASATLLGGAALLTRPQAVPVAATSAPAAPAAVSAPASAPSVPALAMKDRWFEDSSLFLAAPAVSAQARDKWYADPVVISALAISRQAVDKWYLEGAPVTAPAISRQAVDRWYLDDVAVPPAAPLSTQPRDTWYLDR
jgi:hypothetical protein